MTTEEMIKYINETENEKISGWLNIADRFYIGKLKVRRGFFCKYLVNEKPIFNSSLIKLISEKHEYCIKNYNKISRYVLE